MLWREGGLSGLRVVKVRDTGNHMTKTIDGEAMNVAEE